MIPVACRYPDGLPCPECPFVAAIARRRLQYVGLAGLAVVIVALVFSAVRIYETSRFLDGIEAHLSRQDRDSELVRTNQAKILWAIEARLKHE